MIARARALEIVGVALQRQRAQSIDMDAAQLSAHEEPEVPPDALGSSIYAATWISTTCTGRRIAAIGLASL